MSNGLQGITGWAIRAAEANWCITTLAKNCHVSISTLARHFHAATGQCPHDWLNDERMRCARELLSNNTSVKETAILLGYKSQHGFSLAFKKHHAYPPSIHPKKMQGGELKPAGVWALPFRLREATAQAVRASLVTHGSV